MAVTWKALAYQTDVSTADSKAVSAGTAASVALSTSNSADTAQSTSISTADSKGVSGGTAASVALSTSNSVDTAQSTSISTADSKAVSAGTVAGAAGTSVGVSTADSKAVSAGTLASTASSVATSAGTASSTALSTANTHATRHKLGGADVILLNEFGLPTGVVNFNKQQLTGVTLEAVATSAAASFPATPTVGQIVFVTADLAPFVCTVNA